MMRNKAAYDEERREIEGLRMQMASLQSKLHEPNQQTQSNNTNNPFLSQGTNHVYFDDYARK